MTTNLSHTAWFRSEPTKPKTVDGKEISVYEFEVPEDDAAFKAWAKHFREHYCLDSMIDRLRDGTSKSRAQYLTDLVFPDATTDFGPATRSGDFAEILVADLLEALVGYWVPRTRYADKKVRNESPKGSDIIGFKLVNGADRPSKNDTVITFESKAQLSGNKAKPRLQEAVDHSAKDELRLAESLNAAKRRLIEMQLDEEATRVRRFQDPLHNPYIRKSGAAAVFCSRLYDPGSVSQSTDCTGHENENNLMLVVVHAHDFMKIVHRLYAEAANDAEQ